MKNIRILITGGTIDKQYQESDGSLCFHESLINEMLSKGRCTVPIKSEILMLSDSGDFTDTQRAQIQIACTSCSEESIIITHGTDTMTETASYLTKSKLTKTIVLTGAMRPYSFGESDALFNLGSAITAVQCAEHGVYIVMNGQVFPWNKVRKNFERGQFEWV